MNIEHVSPINRFSLAPIDGPYNEWNGKTQLWCNGKQTEYGVRGCDLKAQYRAGDYFILATEYDCPFEESVSITLLSSHFKPIACSTVPQIFYPVVGTPSYFYEKIVWKDDHHFDLYIKDEPDIYCYTIRDNPIPLLQRRLSKRIARRPS